DDLLLRGAATQAAQVRSGRGERGHCRLVVGSHIGGEAGAYLDDDLAERLVVVLTCHRVQPIDALRVSCRGERDRSMECCERRPRTLDDARRHRVEYGVYRQ